MTNFAFAALTLLVAVTAVTHATEPPKTEQSQTTSQQGQPTPTQPASQGSVPSVNVNLVPGPEPRQIAASASGGNGFPYNFYQPPYSGSVHPPASSSSGGGLLSLLRPLQGGRRSSLTSRLRNLMTALFLGRKTSSDPYFASGSSYNYAFRPPPFGFGSGSSGSSGSGLFSSQPSGYKPPVTFPNYQGSASNSAPTWSNYKQWGSNSVARQPDAVASSPVVSAAAAPSYTSQLAQAAATNNYGWTAGSSNSAPNYSNLSPSMTSSYGNSAPQGAVHYQASASNSFPGYSNNAYQRSSSNFKPIPSSSSNNYSISAPPSSPSSSASASSSSSAAAPSSAASSNYVSNKYQ